MKNNHALEGMGRSQLIQRLASIAGAHRLARTDEEREASIAGSCYECGHKWPCFTYVTATGELG